MKTVGGSLKKKKDESNIDLTPMLDVVFILLIFFVVTASFLKENAMDIEGQDPNNNPPPPSNDTPKNILIQIDSRNQLFFNQERIDISAVRARVASARAENPAASVIIRPDKLVQREFPGRNHGFGQGCRGHYYFGNGISQ